MKGKPLSLEETVELLGSDPPEDIGPIRRGPVGMMSLAGRIAQRLSNNQRKTMLLRTKVEELIKEYEDKQLEWSRAASMRFNDNDWQAGNVCSQYATTFKGVAEKLRGLLEEEG